MLPRLSEPQVREKKTALEQQVEKLFYQFTQETGLVIWNSKIFVLKPKDNDPFYKLELGVAL